MFITSKMSISMHCPTIRLCHMLACAHVDILVLLEAHLCHLVMSTCVTCRHIVFPRFLLLLLLLLLLFLLSNIYCVKPISKTTASIELILGG